MSEIPQSVLDGYQGTIEAFVRRARRIEAHSLLADTAQFVAWSTARSASTSAKTTARCAWTCRPKRRSSPSPPASRPLL